MARARAILQKATAVAFLLCAAASSLAQTDTPVPRPAVKPGDTWVYQRTEFESGKVTGRSTTRVVFANDAVIQTVVTRGQDGNEIDESYTADWNTIAGADGSNFNPHTGIFRWPLAVGSSYSTAFENTIPRLGAFRVKHERTVKVAGWEEVTVPAGKFRALKVVVEGTFQRIDQAISGSATSVFWYVPEVKRWVKYTYEDRTFRGRVNWWGVDLVGFKVE